MRLTLRFGTGLLTTVVFLGIGISFLDDPSTQRFGAIMAGLGVLRGGLLVKQFFDERAAEAEEEE